MGESETRGRTTLTIRTLGDPVLKRKAKPVKRVNARVRSLLDAMAATMREAEGVGLAAPQVGISERIIVVDVGEGLVELINPEIHHAEGEQTAFEGCLSIPGKLAEVTRSETVRVSGLNRHGRKVWIDAEGFFARALQHEIDHLNGVLILDIARRVVDLPPESQLRLVLMGTPAFAVPLLDAMAEHGYRLTAVVTAPDRPAGRGLAPRPPALKRAAEAADVRVLQPERLDDPDFMQTLRELRPDVLITAAYGRILPPEVLEVPKVAAINVHASLLPRWRGAAPIQRAIEAGDPETGITYQFMAPELDTGDILLQRAIPIEPGEDAGSLHDRLSALAAEMLPEALRLLASGEPPRRPQNEEDAAYARKLRPEEEWLDWRLPAAVLERKIRALAPRPGACCKWRGELLKILAAELPEGAGENRALSSGPAGSSASSGGSDPLAAKTSSEPAAPGMNGAEASPEPPAPGQVVEAAGDSILVACGEGLLRLLRVQRAGGRPMSAADFLNGNALAPGDRLE